MKRISATFFLLFLSVSSLFAEGEELIREKKLNWEEGFLIIDIRVNLEQRDGKSIPDARYLAEQRIEKLLPALFLESLLDIPIDSYYTMGEKIKEREDLFHRVYALAPVGKKQFGYLSRDMRQVHVRYEFPFFGEQGLIVPFIEHTFPYPLRKSLVFEPSRSFTGLVIYAAGGSEGPRTETGSSLPGGGYPAYGKKGMERIKPAFFPRLYDEGMNLFFSSANCDPEYLKRWGMVAYTHSVDESPFLERVGVFPLRTMARAVYGKNSTDIILPNDTARKLLSRKANHDLLKQGRILIILD